MNADVNETAGSWTWRRQQNGVWIWAAAARRTSCSRPSRKFRRCSASPKGHDYFLAVTGARPDTRPVGATPAEAVSWGKIDLNFARHGDLPWIDDRLPLLACTCWRDTSRGN
jgi:deoxyhypusine synthase